MSRHVCVMAARASFVYAQGKTSEEFAGFYSHPSKTSDPSKPIEEMVCDVRREPMLDR
jgi:hypothetical protein